MILQVPASPPNQSWTHNCVRISSSPQAVPYLHVNTRKYIAGIHLKSLMHNDIPVLEKKGTEIGRPFLKKDILKAIILLSIENISPIKTNFWLAKC